MQAQQHPDEKSLWPKNDKGELAGFTRRFVHTQVLDWLAVSVGLLHSVSFVIESAVYIGQ